jgi:hypothetical protein
LAHRLLESDERGSVQRGEVGEVATYREIHQLQDGGRRGVAKAGGYAQVIICHESLRPSAEPSGGRLKTY